MDKPKLTKKTNSKNVKIGAFVRINNQNSKKKTAKSFVTKTLQIIDMNGMQLAA